MAPGEEQAVAEGNFANRLRIGLTSNRAVFRMSGNAIGTVGCLLSELPGALAEIHIFPIKRFEKLIKSAECNEVGLSKRGMASDGIGGELDAFGRRELI